MKIKAHRKKSEKFQTISCIVEEVTDDKAFEAMITEDLQRRDVDPVGEAFALTQLAEKGRVLEDVALKIGKSTRFVLDRIKLNSLIPELKGRVRDEDIPLSGAMIPSKLDGDTQEELHEEEEEQCTTAMIRKFVSNSFVKLGNTPWIKDDFDNWENTDIKSYPQCENNTYSHSCLFYKMGSKGTRCISAACYEKKQIAYMIQKIQLEYKHLVKVGESLSFGKAIATAGRPDTYWGEDRKVFYEKALEVVKQLGFEIVGPDEIFRYKCWYPEDGGCALKMLEDREAYRYLLLSGHYSPEFNVSFCYVGKEAISSASAVANLKEMGRGKVDTQLKRTKDTVKERSAEEVRKWMQEKTYYQRTKESSENRQLVFDMLVLNGHSSTYPKELNSKKRNGENDFVNYVKNNRAG